MYTHTFMYTWAYYTLQSEVRTSSSFTLMLFVPDENFLSSKRIARIYTHNDGTMIEREARRTYVFRREFAEYKTFVGCTHG